MGASTNRALQAKSDKARKQRVAYATEHGAIASESKREMIEECERAMARRLMWAEHFDLEPTITVCKPGAARNAGELQRKKASGLPMGQQFTNAARADRRRGSVVVNASKGWRV